MSSLYSPGIERAEYSEQAENIRVRWYHQMPRQMVERRMLQGLADKMVAGAAISRRGMRVLNSLLALTLGCVSWNVGEYG